ncbi:MAG TPA: hypothetical protein VFD36_10020 [Kofleriaceae bacterium]|nr:hypothetical protein [Kofleriaceae bacterium]
MVRPFDQQPTTSASETDDAMTPAVTPDAVLLRVQALVARGATPAEVAAAIGPNPSPQVLTYLHQTRGNGFVQQVMFAGAGGGGGPGGGGGGSNTQPSPPPPPAPANITCWTKPLPRV